MFQWYSCEILRKIYLRTFQVMHYPKSKVSDILDQWYCFENFYFEFAHMEKKFKNQILTSL